MNFVINRAPVKPNFVGDVYLVFFFVAFSPQEQQLQWALISIVLVYKNTDKIPLHLNNTCFVEKENI